jgi:CheY-like chemotaxis protein
MSAKRILVVEDNQANRLALCVLLDILGYEYETATEGQEAITSFARGDFDLILMDVAMPLCDGFEATKSIRNLEQLSKKTRKIPIIALTASQEKESCLAHGMDDFLAKPYDLNDLKAMLELWLR